MYTRSLSTLPDNEYEVEIRGLARQKAFKGDKIVSSVRDRYFTLQRSQKKRRRVRRLSPTRPNLVATAVAVGPQVGAGGERGVETTALEVVAAETEAEDVEMAARETSAKAGLPPLTPRTQRKPQPVSCVTTRAITVRNALPNGCEGKRHGSDVCATDSTRRL